VSEPARPPRERDLLELSRCSVGSSAVLENELGELQTDLALARLHEEVRWVRPRSCSVEDQIATEAPSDIGIEAV
jgi:hypothetical protein